MPDCIPYREPGAAVTGRASANVIGKRFVAQTAGIGADGALPIAHAGAGARAVGVAMRDAISGQPVGVIRKTGAVVPVTAGGAIAWGAEVQSDAEGRAVTASSGRVLGYVEGAVTGTGQDARVVLY